jgi:hypothetical protein
MSNEKAQATEGDRAARGGGAHTALAVYEARKHALAQILREVNAAAYRTKQESMERSVAELIRKLADDRFYLTVVGQFSRGKSTLMNAILGKDYLPSGIVPVTSAVTAVSYGSRERVILRSVGSNLTSEIWLHELADFITERTNPGNAGSRICGAGEHRDNAELSPERRRHCVRYELRCPADGRRTRLSAAVPVVRAPAVRRGKQNGFGS